MNEFELFYFFRDECFEDYIDFFTETKMRYLFLIRKNFVINRETTSEDILISVLSKINFKFIEKIIN